MTMAVVLVLAGAGLLAFAGNKLVDFAAALAEKARLTPAVIGLTIVAAGTSAPELLVSVLASIRRSPAIAIGNVLGSNIANIGLILGVSALIAAIPVARRVLRFEYPFLLLASWLVLLLCRDGRIDRLEATFFLSFMGGFLAYSVWVARREVSSAEKRLVEKAVPENAARLSHRPVWVLLVFLLAALGGLLVGAHALVSGAERIARALAVSERIIGLTVVAIGTSVPELVVSVAAALKRQHEMVVATIVGSNIFNLLMILGAAALVRPLPIDYPTAAGDLWISLGMTLLLLPLVLRGRSLSRPGGACVLAVYLSYLLWLGSQAHGAS